MQPRQQVRPADLRGNGSRFNRGTPHRGLAGQGSALLGLEQPPVKPVPRFETRRGAWSARGSLVDGSGDVAAESESDMECGSRRDHCRSNGQLRMSWGIWVRRVDRYCLLGMSPGQDHGVEQGRGGDAMIEQRLGPARNRLWAEMVEHRLVSSSGPITSRPILSSRSPAMPHCWKRTCLPCIGIVRIFLIIGMLEVGIVANVDGLAAAGCSPALIWKSSGSPGRAECEEGRIVHGQRLPLRRGCRQHPTCR